MPSTSRSIIIGFCFLLLPFILLSYCAHPIPGDDYNLALKAVDMGWFESVKWYYNNWTGRYTQIAYVQALPVFFDYLTIYKILPVILFIIFFICTYQIINSILKDYIDKTTKVILSFSFMLVYIADMPDPATGFYWAMCSVQYLGGCFLTMWFVSLLSKKIRFHNFIASLFCTILVVGMSEINMIYMLAIQIFILCLFLWKERQINIYITILFIFAIIFAYIMMTAPGVSVRVNLYPNARQFDLSFTYAILGSVLFVCNWLSNSALILSTILFLPLATKIASKVKNDANPPLIYSVNPVITWLFMFGLIFISFFGLFWAVGNEYLPDRVINMIFLVFVTGWYINILITIFYLYRTNRVLNITYSPYITWGIIIFLGLNTLLDNEVKIRRDKGLITDNSLLSMINYLDVNNNIGAAFHDVISGNAWGYNQDYTQRYNLLKQCKSDTCYLPMINNFPKTLYLIDYPNQVEMVKFYNPNIKIVIQADSTRKAPKKIGF